MKKNILLLIIALLFSTASYAKTDLKLPRYVSLKSSEANVRTGPGLRYQTKWIMVRDQMPVEVIAEFEQWRKIRDVQGDDGWVHRSMLTNSRNVIITGKAASGDVQILHKHASEDATPVARVETGVIAKLLACNKDFCRLQADDYKGWIARNHIWGIYPDEMID